MRTVAASDAVDAVCGRVLAALPSLLAGLGERYRVEVEEYARLPVQSLERDVLSVSRSVVEEFFTALRSGREPQVEAELLEGLGRRRLHMGVSLDAMLHIFRINGRAVFEAVVAAVRPGEEATLGAIGSRWLDYLDECTSAAAVAYLQASHQTALRLVERRRALVDAVLGVRDPSEAAAVGAEFSVRLDAEYAPVRLPVGQDLEGLLACAPAGSLGTARRDGLLLLVPEVARAVPPLLRAAGEDGPVVVGRARPLGEDLRDELARVTVVLDVAVRRGARGRLGALDFLPEQLLLRSPAVAAELEREVLGRLVVADVDGVLLRTLRDYLSTGSLTATAQQVSTHPNTVTYRLRRIAELTGSDPRLPSGAARLALAVAQRDLHDR